MNNQNDTDDDNDGVVDTADAYPYDPARAVADAAVINNNNGVGGVGGVGGVDNNIERRAR
jgi:hypothetical protein